MLFKDIHLLDENFAVREHQYVAIEGEKIAYIGDAAPEGDYGEAYDGQGKLLLPGFYNAHAHTPMTLMRGYGENLTLHTWLETRIFPFEEHFDGDSIYWATMLGLAESLRFGIVSNTDMYGFSGDLARAVLDAGMKANIGPAITEIGGSSERGFEALEAYRKDFHGAGNGRVRIDASLHAEYTSTPAVVSRLANYAAKENLRMHVHVAETEFEAEGCKQRHGKTVARYLADNGLFDVPATAAHCVWLEGDDFALMAEKGVTVASCPVSNMKLASGACDTVRLLREGVNVALGTDSVASNNSLNFLEEMKFFAVLPKLAKMDPTAISPKQALYAATRAGALSQGREGCGLLKEGFRADCVVLDINQPNMFPAHDLLNNVVYSASGSDVCLTMADGKVLYRDGEYLTLDIDRVQREALAATTKILEKLKK